MLFDGWHSLIRVCVVGTLSYIAVVALLRYFGKRALSKMNAFDTDIATGNQIGGTSLFDNRSIIPYADDQVINRASFSSDMRDDFGLFRHKRFLPAPMVTPHVKHNNLYSKGFLRELEYNRSALRKYLQ